MGRHDRRAARQSKTRRGELIAIGMADAGSALPEYHPYTIAPLGSNPRVLPAWPIIAVLVVIGAAVGVAFFLR
jgi:hypothetical protein